MPIPPELVALLREHIDRFGVAEDGRLFCTDTGGGMQDSHYAATWRRARQEALTTDEAASPLAGRPYDLRHAAASLWLNAGVAVTEVAWRLGHGVAVLLKVYADCIDGQEELANERITAALDGRVPSGTLASSVAPASSGSSPVAEQSRDKFPTLAS